MFQGLDEVEVLDAALRTRDRLTVVREEVEPLLRMDDKLSTGGALVTNTMREIFQSNLSES